VHANARIGVPRGSLPDCYRTHTSFQPTGRLRERTLAVVQYQRRGESALKRKRTLTAVLAALAAFAVALTAWTSLAGATPARRTAGSLTGAGSTFVLPLVSRWSTAYHGAKINYSGIGSGGGIAAITARTVDFGASDAPLTPDQFSACKGCVQIPWAFSATSIPYNASGVGYGLKLTGPILANIYLGHITKWNDKRIKAINPNAKLPDEKIVPIYRSDGSGTTYNFTDYLSRVSKEWKTRIGKSTQVNFPTGVGARGSTGVAGALSRTPGGITYVDAEYSYKSHFRIAKIRNRAGKFQLPGLREIRASAASLKRVTRKDNAVSLVDPNPRQPKAYPICTFTWVIVPVKTDKAPQLKMFIDWALTKGQSYGPKLLFVPLPAAVKAVARKTLSRIHT
jgi:phosphate transport system substrate-binding protein